MSKDEIIAIKEAVIASKNAKIDALESENEQLRRALFGQKRERFIPTQNAQQLAFDFGLEAAPVDEDEEKGQEIKGHTRKKSKNQNHPGRKGFPAHFPREEIIIEPEEDVTGMVIIGQEVSEVLHYTPAVFKVKRFIRNKYAHPEKGVLVAEIPDRPFAKCGVDSSVVSHLLVSKFVDHLPFYRLRAAFQRDYELNLPAASISDWFKKAVGKILILYDHMKNKIRTCFYLMVDESRIPVQDKDKKGKNHQGYMWVYYDPVAKIVYFDYQKGRGKAAPKKMLEGFQGYLQTDAYASYEQFDSVKGIDLVSCMAHMRRKFEKALKNDRKSAEHFLAIVQELYKIERELREQKADLETIRKIRQEKSKPLMEELGAWIIEGHKNNLSKQNIGKAFQYAARLWPRMMRYLEDPRIQIDNNLVENSIRPLALGRKNFLHAGSHDAAQNIAVMYSMFATCKKNNVNPRLWLTDVLNRIDNHPINKLDDLLPSNWKPADPSKH